MVRRPFIIALYAAFLIALVVILIEPMIPRPTTTTRSTRGENLRRASNLARMCIAFEAEHGRVPDRLRELVDLRMMSEEDWISSRYVDFESGEQLDWFYLPETSGSRPKVIGPKETRHIVIGFADGGAKIAKLRWFEANYAEIDRKLFPPR